MAFFGILTVVAVGASLAACGSDTSTTTTTTGAGGDTTTSTGDTASSTGGSASTTTTSSTTTTTTTSSSSGSSSSTTSTSTGGSMLINGCDLTKLEDRTSAATVEITFGGGVGLKYSPPCIKVKSGTMVTFKGSTSQHPLAAGEVVNGTPMKDANSPIKDTSGPATVTFALSPAGSYPYYCTSHYGSGMQGLIVAE